MTVNEVLDLVGKDVPVYAARYNTHNQLTVQKIFIVRFQRQHDGSDVAYLGDAVDQVHTSDAFRIDRLRLSSFEAHLDAAEICTREANKWRAEAEKLRRDACKSSPEKTPPNA